MRLKRIYLLGLFLVSLLVGVFILKYLPLDALTGEILKPFWKTESHLGQKLKELFQRYIILTEIKSENRGLKERIFLLEQELAYYKEREALYQRLEELYKITPKVKYPQLVSRIIYKGVDPFSDVLIIDKGTKDGLMPQMPVLALVQGVGIGLVGQVVETYRTWSKVILITDPSFAVDVKILRTQDRAILKGKAEPKIALEFIPLYSQAKEGDWVITSGQDLLFPAGLLVGEILEIKKDPQGLFKRAEVRPFIDLYNLDFVVVQLKVPEVTIE